MATDYERWQEAEAHCRRAMEEQSEFDIPGFFFDQAIGWNELIKTLRRLHGVGIDRAQATALRDPRWRAWVARSVQTNRQCEKQVRHHIARHGEKSLVAWEDGRLVFR